MLKRFLFFNFLILNNVKNNVLFFQDQEVKQDLLHSALDSFYSDIAAIEHPVSGEVFQHPLPVEERKAIENCSVETNQDGTKKKKKKVSIIFDPFLSD